MCVVVAVALREMQPNTKRHEPASREERQGDVLVPEEDREDGTNEWGGGEVGSGPRRAEASERTNEQRKAEPVTKEAQHNGGASLRESWEGPGEKDPNGHVYRSRETSLKGCDLDGIASGDFLGEVVVDRPADAGRCNCERASESPPLEPSLPGEERPSHHNRHHPQGDPPVYVFAEYDPRQERGEHSLEVEEEGGG